MKVMKFYSDSDFSGFLDLGSIFVSFFSFDLDSSFSCFWKSKIILSYSLWLPAGDHSIWTIWIIWYDQYDMIVPSSSGSGPSCCWCTYFNETLFDQIHFSSTDESCNFLQKTYDEKCSEKGKNRKDDNMKYHQTIATKIEITLNHY